MSEEQSSKTVSAVSSKELRKLRDAISARYGMRLRPGESLTIDASRAVDECWARIDLSTVDDSYHIEIECAALASDAAEGAKFDAGTAFDEVLDMLDAQIGEYFENDRFAHFHEDWRVYESEGLQLRLRSRESRPGVEALADAWLASNGAPDEGEPN